MNKQTAMQQLLNKLKNDGLNQPMHIAWKRCYESIEEIIKKTYVEIEKEQIINAGADHCYPTCELARTDAEEYYNKTYKKK